MNSDCIDILTLTRYFGKKLSDKEKQEVEYHLSLCDECREGSVSTFLMLKDNTEEEEPTPEDKDLSAAWQTFKKKLSEGFSRFLEWVVPQPCEPAMVCVRSDQRTPEPCIKFEKEFGNLRADFLFEKISDNNISLEIKVSENHLPAQNISFNLKKESGTEIRRSSEDGGEQFENLSFGMYQLKIRQFSKEKGSFSFEINETGLTQS